MRVDESGKSASTTKKKQIKLQVAPLQYPTVSKMSAKQKSEVRIKDETISDLINVYKITAMNWRNKVKMPSSKMD